MHLIASPTEQTTAATDALVALTSLIGVGQLRCWRRGGEWKASLWAAVFGLLALAAILGATAHGLDLEPATRAQIWKPLNAALGLAVALFVVGAVNDRWGTPVARQFMPLAVGSGLAFFALTAVFRDTFLLFVLYESAAMVFALGLYLAVALQQRAAGSWWMVAGVGFTIIAATIQATHVGAFVLIWSFDHNGAFHLVQLAGILCLLIGLREALQHSRSPLPGNSNPIQSEA